MKKLTIKIYEVDRIEYNQEGQDIVQDYNCPPPPKVNKNNDYLSFYDKIGNGTCIPKYIYNRNYSWATNSSTVLPYTYTYADNTSWYNTSSTNFTWKISF